MMVEMLVNKSGWRIKGVARLYKVTYGRGLAKALRRYSKNLMVYPLSSHFYHHFAVLTYGARARRSPHQGRSRQAPP